MSLFNYSRRYMERYLARKLVRWLIKQALNHPLVTLAIAAVLGLAYLIHQQYPNLLA